MISVLMANYNGEEYLAEALESVVGQEFDGFEVIVVDDGSTDGSAAILDDFERKHRELVRVVRHPENRGQGSAFNTGFEQSRGELICFIDSDDIWFPDKLSKLNKLVAESEKSAIYQHNLLKLDGTVLTEEKFRAGVFTGDLYQHSKFVNGFPLFIPTTGLAFPRAVLERVMPVPMEFVTSADAYLTRTAFCHGLVTSTNDCWGAYRFHGGNRVYGSAAATKDNFRNEVIIPALNAYYSRNGFDLRFRLVAPAEVYKKSKSNFGVVEGGAPENMEGNRVGEDFIIAQPERPSGKPAPAAPSGSKAEAAGQPLKEGLSAKLRRIFR